MNPLLRLEKWLDSVITTAFARLFRSPVDPIEIAAALRRECQDKATNIGGGRRLVPNEFAIELPAADFQRIDDEEFQRQLIQALDNYVSEEEFTLAGPINIALVPNPSLESGLFALRSTSLSAIPESTEGEIFLEVGTRKFTLKQGIFRIGRDDSMDLRLEDPGVSRHHCDIEINGGAITVHDHNSTNGTLVNGVAISRGTLVNGSRIRIGGTDLILHQGGDR